MCKECPVYKNNWSCPPFNFNPEDIWKSYNSLKIVAFKFDFSKEILSKKFSEDEITLIFKGLKEEKNKLINVLYELEKDKDNSMALFLGHCELCDKCTKEINKPRIYPEKMRHSIESLGGDVDYLIEDLFGYKILWPKEGKIPKYLIFVGGLLYNKKS